MTSTLLKDDLKDIQIHVLTTNDPVAVIYAFFRIDDPASFRTALGGSLACPSEAAGNALPERSLNIGFTPAGLKVLGVDEQTLGTFPEPFREGMAARAELLGDVGDEAPENWDGYLGSREVHGVFWVSALVRDGSEMAVEKAQSSLGSSQRQVESLLGAAGCTVLQVEVGEANYRWSDAGERYRVTHFGWRDGISQPWVDVGESIPPGGGTPRPDGSWAPLAPGEFVLGHPDEDGLVQCWPANKALRQSGTYMVFRKLEQDVVGFRLFLRRAAGGEAQGRRLGAQMIGRWPDGTPVIDSPDGPSNDMPSKPNRQINDFRYERDDPHGQRCPFGSHIRRANPRDTGNRDDARRHRIMRRGISYGGKLLADNLAGDGRERGLYFVAFNARIDQQFEHVQARWMNGGEMSGQVLTGQDPLTGSRRGAGADAFQSSLRPAPITGLPRFVKLRGGDYFFVPGLAALKRIEAGDAFAAEPPLPEDALGRMFKTPDAPDMEKLGKVGRLLLQQNAPPFIEEELQYQPFPESELQPRRIAYVARHDLVTAIFKDDATWSVAPYAERAGRMTGGGQLLISMGPENPERAPRIAIMREALKRLCERRKVPDLGTLFAKETRTIVQRLLQSANPFGRVDVVGDIGRVVPVMLAERIWGVAGPGFVSPTGVAAKFARSAVTDMAPSWPRSLPAIPDNLKPLTTMQAWCRLAFLQIFVNVINRSDLATIAQSSTLELMQHIEGVITKARMHKPRNEETLVGCLVQMGDKPSDHNMSQQKFDEHMRLILAELVVGGIETCNKALASIVNYALDHRNVLDAMVDAIEDDADDELDKLIREALRHDPVSPILFRVAARDGKIGGKDVARGTLVCLLVQAAMMDPRVFGHEPTIFAPNNNPENYLHFGTAGPLPAAPHACAGRDFVGAELRELVRAIVALRRLRRAAGPLGSRIDESRLPTSMVLRFDPA